VCGSVTERVETSFHHIAGVLTRSTCCPRTFQDCLDSLVSSRIFSLLRLRIWRLSSCLWAISLRIGERSCKNVLSFAYGIVQPVFQGHIPHAYVVPTREVQLVGILSQPPPCNSFASLAFWLRVKDPYSAYYTFVLRAPRGLLKTIFTLPWLCRSGSIALPSVGL
jgi:hypothetical protein